MTEEHILDAKGLSCPEPIMMLHGVVRDAATGERIFMQATDPSSERDVKKFCTFLGHELAECREEAGVYYFELIKGQG
ncbi:sulfurtransferase TusA [Agaribacterium sp. ZY112]|uniref:sulfurtransferase TusA n=1 Tax=Agaribacterium sp. ZY112 TaxID=3233574 RepID=UPI0035258363